MTTARENLLTHLTADEWRSLIVAVITAAASGIASCIIAWRTGTKIDNHDARAAARARERGEPANPDVHPGDRGHV